MRFMRPFARTLAAVFLVALAGCGPLRFDVEVEADTTIESGGLLGGLLSTPFAGFASFDITSSQEFRNQGVSRDQVESVRLTALELSVREPAGATFDFLDGIEFFVEAEGLERRRVASLSPVARGQTALVLELDDVELAPYVAAPSLSLTARAQGRPPAQDTKVHARAVFEVVPRLF